MPGFLEYIDLASNALSRVYEVDVDQASLTRAFQLLDGHSVDGLHLTPYAMPTQSAHAALWGVFGPQGTLYGELAVATKSKVAAPLWASLADRVAGISAAARREVARPRTPWAAFQIHAVAGDLDGHLRGTLLPAVAWAWSSLSLPARQALPRA